MREVDNRLAVSVEVATKVCLPVGAKVQLIVDGRQAFVGWS